MCCASPRSNKRLRAIFFDVDGVLIDGYHSRPERRRRWDAYIERDLGIPQHKFQEIFSGFFVEVLHGRRDLEEELTRWLKKNDYDLKAWQVMNYWHSQDAVLNAPVWNAAKALAARGAVPLYTATNQSHARIAYLRDTLGFGAVFQDFFYSARLGCLKSDPAFFARIEAALNLKLADGDGLLYFDDDPVNIANAAARGWDAVLVDGPEDVTGHPTIRSLLV